MVDNSDPNIAAYDSELYSVTERFGVSRETGYKWIRRYRTEEAAGLEHRSRARSVATTRRAEGLSMTGSCESVSRSHGH